MLTITVPASPDVEVFDEQTNTFSYMRGHKEQKLQLEHSLISIKKWESKWHKPFLGSGKKTEEEMQDYVRCMTITQNVDPAIYTSLSKENVKAINDYIDNPMTATVISNHKKKNGAEIITNEIIYYWMIAFNIPESYQKWHLNQLLTLIQVCDDKNAPAKKMSNKAIYEQNRALNAARKAKLHTKG